MAILDKIFGNANEQYTKRAQSVVEKINSLEKNVQSLSAQELKAKTQEFKDELASGKTLDDILPEAFALVRETAKRTLGQRHYDVQLVGGMVLYEGKIAEMRTGEGKTLTATTAAYVNALTGKGAHIVTVNDYLAKRDAVWMGQIYDALGLSVGCIVHDAAYIYNSEYTAENSDDQDSKRDEVRDATGSFKVEESYLQPVSRKEAYAADITYGTNNEFGFDYLRDNMVYDLKDKTQRGHYFVIIDEVDSILIDEARTPLIISAPDQKSSSWYSEFAKIAPLLNKETDFEVDEKLKAISITEAGIDKVEQSLGVKDIYQERGIKYVHHLESALKAEILFERDKDYVVRNGQVIIVDEFTGRLLEGRRYSGGLHQALEAKEGVAIQPESLTLASITFQNYFRMYERISGMTGTAMTSAEEFHKVYGLESIVVPTNKPMIREDLPDRVYKSDEGKFQAVVQEVKERSEKGQPVLIGTVSIQRNERLGQLLSLEGVKHEVLNAKHHEREGQIIAQAGRLGAVTVATNMAGRGVDIVLGGNPSNEQDAQKVKELGGLHVIGTERHEARRIDNQLRGRTGRQGDPGSSQFFISLEDDLARVFGGDRLKGLMNTLKIPEDQPIESRLVSNSIESAQSKIEGLHFDARKHLLDYDDVLSKHREIFYKKRKEVLEKASKGDLKSHLLGIAEKYGFTAEQYEEKEKELGEENMRQAERVVVFRVTDSLWIEHLENMEYLRDSVRLRAYGQQDPLVEYKHEGHRMFRELLEKNDEIIANSLFHVHVKGKQESLPQQSSSALKYSSSSTSTSAPSSQTHVQPKKAKVGRNEPCPCGSGKKFKKCHGRQE